MFEKVKLMGKMMRGIIRGICLFLFAMAAAAEPMPHSYTPKDGFVPNEFTAISIAVAVWTPIYGEDAISKQQPYKAVLAGDTWIVEGSLPRNMVGGVALAEIAKKDGRILRVTHGK
jgi:hypothetical protein